MPQKKTDKSKLDKEKEPPKEVSEKEFSDILRAVLSVPGKELKVPKKKKKKD